MALPISASTSFRGSYFFAASYTLEPILHIPHHNIWALPTSQKWNKRKDSNSASSSSSRSSSTSSPIETTIDSFYWYHYQYFLHPNMLSFIGGRGCAYSKYVLTVFQQIVNRIMLRVVRSCCIRCLISIKVSPLTLILKNVRKKKFRFWQVFITL